VKNVDKSLGTPGPEFEMFVADKNIECKHQQQKRIKPRKAGPEECDGSASGLVAGYRRRVIVVNDKTAQDEEQRHAETGGLFYPIDIMAGHQHRNAVRDHHTKRRNETQTRQSGHGIAMDEARHGAELHLFPAHP